MQYFPSYIVVLAFNCSLFAQELEWEYVTTQTSHSISSFITSNGDIIQTRWGDFDTNENLVARVSKDGDLIWEKNICNCSQNGVIITAELENENLIHLMNNGDYYQTDSFGDNPNLIGKLFFDSYNKELRGIINKAQRVENIIIAMGRKIEGSETVFVRTYFDLESFDHQVIVDSTDYTFKDFHKNTETENTVELFKKGSDYYYKYYNHSEDSIIEKLLDFSDEVYLNVALSSDDNIILSGYKKHLGNMRIGLVRSLSFSGEEYWVHVDEFEDGVILGTKTGIVINGNDLYVGGNMGMYFTDARLTLFDRSRGTIKWDFIQDILGEGERFNELHVVENDHIILSGTAGLTDVGGPQRAFLMKVNTTLSSSAKIEEAEANIIYPNPTFNLINFDLEQEVLGVEIFNSEGRKLELKPFEKSLNLKEYKPGVYFIKFETEESILVEKIIKI